MIFSFKKNKVSSTKTTTFSQNSDLDYSKLIDVSLMKLSKLQVMGKARTERQILLVMDVLQWSLYYKSLNDYGQLSVSDLIYNFELEIMKSMDRCDLDRLPRLWIDLPDTMSKSEMISVAAGPCLPFRIKAAFSKLDKANLIHILKATLSNDASIRRSAESTFLNTWVPHPDTLFPALLSLMADPSADEELACTAAVFFRRWIARSSVTGDDASDADSSAAFFHLTDAAAVQRGLLDAFSQARFRSLRNRVADAIGQVASLTAAYEEWQDLVQLIISSLQSDNVDVITAMLRVITGSPDLFNNLDSAHLNQLIGLIQARTTAATAVESLNALTALSIYFYGDEKRRSCFQSVVSEGFLGGLLKSVNEAQLWNSAADLVFECPRLFASKKNGSALLSFYLGLAAQCLQAVPVDEYASGDDGPAPAALEFVCAAVEGSPATFKREKGLLEAAVVLLLQVTAMEDGSTDWLQTDPTDEEDIVSFSVLGQQALDRFALALGGEACGPVLFSHISRLLTGDKSTSNWRNPFAGLMAVASSAEGCAQNFLEDQLEGLLACIWPLFEHPHPRVQYASCHALGQLCTDFPGRIQAEAAPAALTALVGLLARQSEARVSCHASAALVNFAEGCDQDSITPFLEGILSQLAHQLSSPNNPPYLQEQLLATIAAYSGAAETQFAAYYDRLMPLLMSGLQSPQRKVQCRAVEAVSLVMTAVKVPSPAPGFLEHLRQLEEQLASPACPADDPMREFLPSAWLRMAQLMGDAFAPWLPIVLPGLIKGVQLDALSVVEDGNDANDQANEDSPVEIVRVGNRNVGVNTAQLGDKAAALETLAALITATPRVFPQPTEVFSAVTCPLINYEWSGEVRAGAVEASLACIEAVRLQSSAQAVEMASQFIQLLLVGLSELYEADFACAALDALSSLIVSLKGSLPPSILGSLYGVLPALVDLVRANLREAAVMARAAEEAEEGDAEAEGEDGSTDWADEEEVLYAWGRLQASLFEAFPSELSAHSWAVTLATGCLNKKSKDFSNEAVQHVCLGLLCDWMVQCGEAGGAVMHGQALIDVCLQGLSSGKLSGLVKQSAVHLGGLLASKGGPAFKEFCVTGVAPLLSKLIGRADARAPSQAAITDNAVSSLIRIHRAFGLVESDGGLIERFLLPGLPVLTDEAEVGPVAEFLIASFDANARWAGEVLAGLRRIKMKDLSPERRHQLEQFLSRY